MLHARASPGLVVYRFGADIYYANASRLSEEINIILARPQGAPVWFAMDAAGIADIDFSGGETLRDLMKEMNPAARAWSWLMSTPKFARNSTATASRWRWAMTHTSTPSKIC